MATTFTVLHNGQRHSVKLTPMQQLSQILESVGKRINQKLDLAACKLLHNKKQLDLSLPVRFANIPSGSTLELHSGAERKLGIQDGPAPLQPSSSSAPAAKQPDSQQPESQQAGPSTTQPAPQQPAPSHTSTSGPTGPSSTPANGPQESEAGSLQQQPQEATEGVDPISLGRPILLFEREAAAGQADSASNEGEAPQEPDDSYFEFTAEDYHRVMASQQATKNHAESGLRTEKLREQELQRRAAAQGPVPIHVHFQDGLVLQAKFQALEELSELEQLVQKCLAPDIKSWSLYTTPPKQVMKNFKINFYKAGLVPAANVYFSTGAESAAEHEGPLLRAEVLALKGPAPIDRGLLQQQRKDETRTSSQVKQTRQAQQDGTTQERRPGNGGNQGKPVPKWMKLGKK